MIKAIHTTLILLIATLLTLEGDPDFTPFNADSCETTQSETNKDGPRDESENRSYLPLWMLQIAKTPRSVRMQIIRQIHNSSRSWAGNNSCNARFFSTCPQPHNNRSTTILRI
jgi:hypothetical protein